MITYRLLSAADSTKLYECFLEAFSDYQVDMRAPREEFEQRLVRDGVRLEISAAAFDETRMVGFYMNALGDLYICYPLLKERKKKRQAWLLSEPMSC